MRDLALPSAECANRDRTRHREQIDRLQQRRVAPGDERRKEHERRRHVPPSLMQRDVADLKQDGERGDERDRPDQDVDAGRPSVEEDIGEQPQRQGRAAKRQSKPVPPRHGCLCYRQVFYKSHLSTPGSGRRTKNGSPRCDGVLAPATNVPLSGYSMMSGEACAPTITPRPPGPPPG